MVDFAWAAYFRESLARLVRRSTINIWHNGKQGFPFPVPSIAFTVRPPTKGTPALYVDVHYTG